MKKIKMLLLAIVILLLPILLLAEDEVIPQGYAKVEFILNAEDYMELTRVRIDIYRDGEHFGTITYPDSRFYMLPKDSVYLMESSQPPYSGECILDTHDSRTNYVVELTLRKPEVYPVTFQIEDAENKKIKIKSPKIVCDGEDISKTAEICLTEGEYDYVVSHGDYVTNKGIIYVYEDMEPVIIEMTPLKYKLSFGVKNSYNENVNYTVTIDGSQIKGSSATLRKGTHKYTVSSEGNSKSGNVTLNKDHSESLVIDPIYHYLPTNSSKTFYCPQNQRKTLYVQFKMKDGTTSKQKTVPMGVPQPGSGGDIYSITVAGVVKELRGDPKAIKWVVIKE